jgi:hypothetical protein
MKTRKRMDDVEGPKNRKTSSETEEVNLFMSLSE